MKTLLFIFFSISGICITAQTLQNNLTPDLSVKADSGKLTVRVKGIQIKNETWSDQFDGSTSQNRSINYNKAYYFNADRTLKIPYNISNPSRFTFITVYQSEDASVERGIWGTKDDSREITLSTRQVNSVNKITAYKGGEVVNPVINTIIQYWGKSQGKGEDSFILLGNSGDQQERIAAHNGIIAEFLVYERALNKIERQQVETALAIKYGITLKGVDYIDSAEKIIWDAEHNEDFSYRMAGIARDDKLSLDQKQSSSSEDPGKLVIALNKIESTGLLNSGKLNNMEFLIWGDNNQPVDFEEEQKETPEEILRIQRKWLMNRTGQLNNPSGTQLRFDLTGLQVPEGFRPVLIIDRTGKGSFDNDETEYFLADEWPIEDRYALFNNVHWDTDRSSKDLFTFGIAPVEDLPNELEAFQVYPSPSGGPFSVKVDLKEESAVTLRIFDISGKLVREFQSNGQSGYEFAGDIREPGLYLVELTSESLKETRELIISNSKNINH